MLGKVRTPDLIVTYHHKHWWKIWPRVGYVKANSARIFEVVISRYGFQWMWTVAN